MTGRNIILYVKSKLQDNMHKLLMQSFTKSKREWCIISNTYIFLNYFKRLQNYKNKISNSGDLCGDTDEKWG